MSSRRRVVSEEKPLRSTRLCFKPLYAQQIESAYKLEPRPLWAQSRGIPIRYRLRDIFPLPVPPLQHSLPSLGLVSPAPQ